MTNEELLDKLNLQNQRLNELKKENEELKKKVFIQEEIIIGEQTENEELKAQIEKMKCCENCRNFDFTDLSIPVCEQCRDGKDNWELRI